MMIKKILTTGFIMGLFLLSVSAISAPDAITSEKSSGGLSSLAQKLGIGGSNEPLHPDEAFQLSVTAEGSTLSAIWTVTPEHYIYRDKIRFKVKSPESVTLGKPEFPESKTKKDPYLGDTEVYEHSFAVRVPVITSGDVDEITVETTYQGCSESTGICYPPQKKTHTVKLSSIAATKAPAAELPQDVVLENTTADSASTGVVPGTGAYIMHEIVPEQDAILDKIKNKSSLGTIFMFLLFGIGLALTPCVFPMIPILSGIIAGQGKQITTRKAFALSLAYVIPMAIIYAIIGVIAGLGGANIQVIFQNPWVISAFAIIFVLLSLSMFGFYELQMPTSIQSKLTSISNRQESGSYIGAAIMGVLSALIVGPCVTAPLIAALTYIAQTGDAVLGGFSLFALGLGMGLPLILIGTSAGKLLPKVGAWMDATKAVFGVLMLALAIWMLERILPFTVIIALSAILLIISGIYLKALSPLADTVSKWAYLWKGVGFILLLYGSLMLVGVASGGHSLIQPLKGLFGRVVSGQTVQQQGLIFQRIRSLDELDAVLARAKNTRQAVMLDFYADWCISCKEMEHVTFKDPGVIQALDNVILIQADVTENNEDDKALLKKFGLFGPPGIIFFTPDGEENKAYRAVGFVKPEKFKADVERFLREVNPE